MIHLKRFLATIAIVYCCVLGATYFFQRHLLYPASGQYAPPASTQAAEVSEHIITAPDGTRVMHWYMPAQAGKPTLMYFHGNADSVKYLAPHFTLAAEHGFGMFLSIYRGYPGSEGKPTEARIYADAARAVDYAVNTLGVPHDDMVLLGRSLGTGVAVELATRIAAQHTVLISPYTSTVDVAKRSYFFLPVDWLMKDRFDSLSKIERIKTPLWVFHGTEDTLIPPAHGMALFDTANTAKKLTLIDGMGHHPIDMRYILREMAEQL